MATRTIDPLSGSDGASPTKRRYGAINVAATVDTTLGNCDVIDIREMHDIAVKPSAGITTLTVYASETAAGTFVIIDSIGTNGAVTVVASKWNTLDITKIGPYGFLKMVPNTNGTVSVVGKT